MTVLIAGVGYLGASLAQWYLDQGTAVVGLENFYCTEPASLAFLRRQPGFHLVRGSVTSPVTLDRVFAQGPFEVVHLLAAQPSAGDAAAHPLYTERTNVTGARMVLDAAAGYGAQRVVFGSSFHVYGAPLSGAVNESRPYGAFSDLTHLSKVYVEKLIEMYARTRDLAGASVRLGIVYGLGPVMKRDAPFQTVPHRFAAQAAAGQTLTVNPAASSPLGFIHLSDAMAALVAAGEHPERSLVANAVSEALTVGEVADAVASAAEARGLSVTIDPADAPHRPVPDRFRVISRLADVGWHPESCLAETIGEVIDYFLSGQSRAR